MKKKFSQKQIPTILGMVILVVALIGGIFFIGQGGGVFAPRATAQTTPKKVALSNVKEDSFTVSFVTDDSTAGFIKYGTDPKNLTTQASDDRDQFSGNVGQYNTHHISVHNLQASTTYYYLLGTAAGSAYDNNGTPYSIKTTPNPGSLPIAKTIYGTVNSASGTPASGVMVYVTLSGAYQLSALTKDSGSWAIPLSNARNQENGTYRAVDPTEQITVSAQGNDATITTSGTMAVANAQPVPTISLGQNSTTQTTPASTTQANSATTTTTAATDTTSNSATTATVPAGQSLASITNLPAGSASGTSASGSGSAALNTTVMIGATATATQSVQTVQPVIEGNTAVPNVIVKIQIHSSNPITTQEKTDSQGNYTVDLQQLSQKLAPGSHTVTVTYANPNDPTKTITQTQTFTVQDQGALALANTSPTPYSTSNPYVLTSPTPDLTVVPSSTPYLTASPAAVVAVVGTGSALPVTGSTDTTLMLIGGGLFFILLGGGSFWLSAQQPHFEDIEDINELQS